MSCTDSGMSCAEQLLAKNSVHVLALGSSHATVSSMFTAAWS